MAGYSYLPSLPSGATYPMLPATTSTSLSPSGNTSLSNLNNTQPFVGPLPSPSADTSNSIPTGSGKEGYILPEKLDSLIKDKTALRTVFSSYFNNIGSYMETALEGPYGKTFSRYVGNGVAEGMSTAFSVGIAAKSIKYGVAGLALGIFSSMIKSYTQTEQEKNNKFRNLSETFYSSVTKQRSSLTEYGIDLVNDKNRTDLTQEDRIAKAKGQAYIDELGTNDNYFSSEDEEILKTLEQAQGKKEAELLKERKKTISNRISKVINSDEFKKATLAEQIRMKEAAEQIGELEFQHSHNMSMERNLDANMVDLFQQYASINPEIWRDDDKLDKMLLSTASGASNRFYQGEYSLKNPKGSYLYQSGTTKAYGSSYTTGVSYSNSGDNNFTPTVKYDPKSLMNDLIREAPKPLTIKDLEALIKAFKDSQSTYYITINDAHNTTAQQAEQIARNRKLIHSAS